MNISLFSKLISINSIYPNEHTLGAFLCDYMEKLWFAINKEYIHESYRESEIDATRYNIIATKWTWSQSIVFYAHMDTVPIHDKLLWESDPLTLTMDEKNPDIARGLWSVDMKGGLSAILESIADIEPQKYKLKIIFWCDEECRSKWWYSLMKSDIFDDVAIIISPETWTSIQKDKNTKNIILWRRWRLVIHITVPGKSCHGGIAQQEGINAITQASILATYIDEHCQQTKTDELLPMGNQFVKWFTSHVSSLSVPDKAELIIDRHIVRWETANSAIQELNIIIKNLINQGKLKEIPGHPFVVKLFERPTPPPQAYVTDSNNVLVQKLLEAAKSTYTQTSIWYWYSVADENVFAQSGVPIVVLWPDWWNGHWANERVSLQSIEKLITTYKTFLHSIEN